MPLQEIAIVRDKTVHVLIDSIEPIICIDWLQMICKRTTHKINLVILNSTYSSGKMAQTEHRQYKVQYTDHSDAHIADRTGGSFGKHT